MVIRSPTDLGAVIRERRRKLGLDQQTLAERVGVSRQWIVEVEKGKPGASLGLVLRTLTDLDIPLSTGAPSARGRQPSIAPDIDAVLAKARRKKR